MTRTPFDELVDCLFRNGSELEGLSPSELSQAASDLGYWAALGLNEKTAAIRSEADVDRLRNWVGLLVGYGRLVAGLISPEPRTDTVTIEGPLPCR